MLIGKPLVFNRPAELYEEKYELTRNTSFDNVLLTFRQFTSPTQIMTSNIDPAEINKFNKLAAAWWDPHGQCKPLHDINPLRVSFIMQHCSIADKKIIDIGCGGGILTESLAREGALLTGIDMSPDALMIANTHAQSNHLTIEYQQTTAEAFATQHPQQFDIVTCMELLEHVPDPISIIRSCARLVKPHGHIFFSTLNRNLKSYAMAIIGAEYLLKMLPQGTHDYAKFIKPSELEGWIRGEHLQLKALGGISYNPLIRSYSLSDDVSVNYLAYCQPQ